MTYKIQYILHNSNGDQTHSRFYRALNPETAINMFEETCNAGSLTGEDTELKGVYENNGQKWQKVDRPQHS